MNLEKLVDEQKFQEILLYFKKKQLDTDIDYLALSLSLYYTGEVNKAVFLLNELIKTSPNNLDAVYNLSKINFELNNQNEAYKWLNHYLQIDKKNWEIFDMLSQLHFSNNEYDPAIKNLDDSINNAHESVLTSLKTKKKKIQGRLKKAKRQKKLAVICTKGLDTFIHDISFGLSKDYWVKKFIVSNNDEIFAGIDWGDIIWLEWANEAAIVATNYIKLIDKIVIIRIHGYEIFTDMPSKINWNVIDRAIFVAAHKRELFFKLFDRLIPYQKTELLRNGVNKDKFTISPSKRKNKNIAFIGNINYRKGFLILIQFFYELLQHDLEYKLYIRGDYQDVRYEMAIKQMINELKIEKNIIFENRVADLNKWLENKTFILSTSIEESFHYTIAEGMLAGLKPVVHAWRESRDIWPNEYIYNNMQQFLNIILSDEFNPAKYRKYVLKNYPLENQLKLCKELIHTLEERYKFNEYNNNNNNINQKDISAKTKLKEFTVIDGALTKISGHNMMFARDYCELLKETKVKIICSDKLKQNKIEGITVLPLLPNFADNSLNIDINKICLKILECTHKNSLLFFQSGDYTALTTILALLLSHKRKVAILYHGSSTLMNLPKNVIQLVSDVQNNNLFIFSTTDHAAKAGKKVFYNNKKIYFTNNIYYYFHHKELFEKSKPHKINSKIKIGYFGISRMEKGFHHLPNLIKSAPENFEFHVQTSPLTSGFYEKEVLKAHNKLLRFNNIIFYNDMLPEEFTKFLFTPHISLMLYDTLIYHNRLSSIYTESIACGMPVIMTKGLWYCKELEHYKAGIGINPNNSKDFNNACYKIFNNYQEYSNNAKTLFKNIFAENNNKIFLERMLDIVLD